MYCDRKDQAACAQSFALWQQSSNHGQKLFQSQHM